MKKLACILGMLIGIAVTAWSIVYYLDMGEAHFPVGDGYSTEIEYKTYGGDAYTDIQNAIVTSIHASDNIEQDVERIGYKMECRLADIQKQLVTIPALVGVSMFLISLYKLSDCTDKKGKDNDAAPTNQEVVSDLE